MAKFKFRLHILEDNDIILIFSYLPEKNIFLDIYTLSRLSRNEKCQHKTYFVRSPHICSFVEQPKNMLHFSGLWYNL